MNHNNNQTNVGQNPEFSEEISWQESASGVQVFMLKTGEGLNSFSPRNCFPTTSAVASFSSFNNQKLSSLTTGDVF